MKKIILISTTIILLLCFSIISFAAVPNGYSFKETVNIRNLTNVACIQKKNKSLIPGFLEDFAGWQYVQGTFLQTPAGISVYNTVTDDQFYEGFLGVTLATTLLDNSPYVDPYFNVIKGEYLYFEMTVYFQVMDRAGTIDDYIDNGLLENYLVWNPSILLNQASSDLPKYTSTYTRVSDKQLKFNFTGFINTTYDEISMRGLSFVFNTKLREGDSFAVIFENPKFYYSLAPDYIYVNGELINRTNQLDLAINALENSILSKFEPYENGLYTFLPSPTNTYFLELGNEFAFTRELVDNAIDSITWSTGNGVSYFRILIKFSIGIGLIGLLLGVAPIFFKKKGG